MKKIFTLKSSLKYLPEVIRISELVLSDEEFLKEVSLIKKFDGTTKSGLDVVVALKFGATATVTTYKTWSPWSKVIAKTVGKTISFNTRNNPRDIAPMVNTLIHEYTHVLGFSHNGNSSVENQNSISYYIGDIAEKYAIKYMETV